MKILIKLNYNTPDSLTLTSQIPQFDLFYCEVNKFDKKHA